ncbi:MAG: peptidoglycan-associated lipoprotein Pal [Deltaproteobacteria bacterium]|nr:peptidoglycan-associated lipoprotein Pal [Deltaproteobacteria bacterium]
MIFIAAGCAQQAATTEEPPPVVEAEAPPPEVETQPEPPPPPTFEVVYFDFDKSEIKPEFETTIQANAEKLVANAEVKVVIEGHCDERGTNEYNLALGERRAQAIRNALVAAGASPDQLSTISFGEERPAVEGADEAAWSKNRRAEVVISE